MPLHLIQPTIWVAFFAVWAMIATLVLRHKPFLK